jgi:radical SAM protein with 4Fe4S-binding SPASM domain
MKVTFLTTTYNHEKYIRKCVQSVIDQDYPDVEHIIVDDGSIDATPHIIKEMIMDHPDTNIRYYHQENKGVRRLEETYNYGLSKASGEIIAILEGDDRAFRYRASEHVKAFADPEVIVSWGPMERWQEDTYLGISPTNYQEFEGMAPMEFFRNMMFQCYIPAGASAIRKSALDGIGGFRAGDYYVDYPTWLSLLPKGKFAFTPRPLSVWGVHGDSYSTVLGPTARPDMDAASALSTYPDELRAQLPSREEIFAYWKSTQKNWRFGTWFEKFVKKTARYKMFYTWPAIVLYKMRSQWAVPTSLLITLSPHCNIRCKYCMREQFKPPGKNITLATLKHILEDRMPFIGDVCIQGLCEPYMNPELSEMLRYMKSRGLHIALTTNGTIPIKDLDALRCVDDFVFSIDTADPETFTYLRGGAKLEDVVGNMRRVIEWKRAHNLGKHDNPPIHINSVITTKNIDQMPGLFDLLEEFKDDLNYVMVDAVSRPDYQSFEQPLALSGDTYRKKIEEIAEDAKKRTLNILGFDYMLSPSYNWAGCPLAWYELFVEPNGDAYICYYDYARVIGNIFTTHPLFVHNSKIAREFRQALSTDDPPVQQCHSCNFARLGWQPGGEYITVQGHEKRDVGEE